MKAKVFCIGFHKTGTSSMGVALRELGYKVTGPNGVHDPDIAKNVLTMAYEVAEEFDAFQDNPWPFLYREMDARYPGSKFILTSREPDSWIKSQVRHFGTRETPMRQWIYGVGCPEGNEDIYINRMKSHDEEVKDYFKDRPDDFLVMDLPRGDGWDKLCPFLGADVPTNSFPHVNKATDRESNQPLLVKKVNSLLGRVKRRLT
jgi:hypothetical protein